MNWVVMLLNILKILGGGDVMKMGELFFKMHQKFCNCGGDKER
jgi:hypothetical protein